MTTTHKVTRNKNLQFKKLNANPRANKVLKWFEMFKLITMAVIAWRLFIFTDKTLFRNLLLLYYLLLLWSFLADKKNMIQLWKKH